VPPPVAVTSIEVAEHVIMLVPLLLFITALGAVSCAAVLNAKLALEVQLPLLVVTV